MQIGAPHSQVWASSAHWLEANHPGTEKRQPRMQACSGTVSTLGQHFWPPVPVQDSRGQLPFCLGLSSQKLHLFLLAPLWNQTQVSGAHQPSCLPWFSSDLTGPLLCLLPNDKVTLSLGKVSRASDFLIRWLLPHPGVAHGAPVPPEK